MEYQAVISIAKNGMQRLVLSLKMVQEDIDHCFLDRQIINHHTLLVKNPAVVTIRFHMSPSDLRINEVLEGSRMQF